MSLKFLKKDGYPVDLTFTWRIEDLWGYGEYLEVKVNGKKIDCLDSNRGQKVYAQGFFKAWQMRGEEEGR